MKISVPTLGALLPRSSAPDATAGSPGIAFKEQRVPLAMISEDQRSDFPLSCTFLRVLGGKPEIATA